MGKPGVERMRMMRACIAHRSHGAANHDGNFDFAVGRVMSFGRLLYDLRHRFQHKVEKHFVYDDAAARHGRTDTKPGGSQFADASIPQPVVAEFLPQSPGLAEITAPWTDALSDVNRVVIARHLFAQRLH